MRYMVGYCPSPIFRNRVTHLFVIFIGQTSYINAVHFSSSLKVRRIIVQGTSSNEDLKSLDPIHRTILWTWRNQSI